MNPSSMAIDANTSNTMIPLKGQHDEARVFQRLRIVGLSDDDDEEPWELRKPKKRKITLVNAEFETLFSKMTKHEKGAEQALLEMILEDVFLASSTFSILEHKQEAHPLFHFAQSGSLESVMTVYSLYPKAIFSRTKSGYSPHHFAAGNRNDDVLRFLVLQHPKALAGKPSILGMLTERIHALPLIQFCLSQYPQGLYETCDTEGNKLLHKACQVNSFPYLGPRPALIDYLVKEYPQAVEISNTEGNLPLHLLLEHSPLLNNNTIHTKSALLLLAKYPKSKQLPNHAGILPLELAMDHGGAAKLILELSEEEELLLPSHSPHVISAHLLQTCPSPHLIQCKVWDAVCPVLAKAVASILYNNNKRQQYEQVTIAFTRIEKTGLTLILQALERNTEIQQCTLSANVGFYNLKVGGDAPEYPPSSLICVAQGGCLASDSNLSIALQRLFCFNTTLHALDLSDNLLPMDPQWLFPLMSNRSLKWLSLARTCLGNSVLQAIIPVLRHNKTLTDLNLSCASISQESILELIDVLKETRTLRRVVFLSATPRTRQASIATLQANPHLYHIHFEASQQSLDLEYWSQLNRAGRYYAREKDATKHDFVTKILLGCNQNVSLLFGLLRDAVPLWATA